jgi:hypothetical protein
MDVSWEGLLNGLICVFSVIGSSVFLIWVTTVVGCVWLPTLLMVLILWLPAMLFSVRRVGKPDPGWRFLWKVDGFELDLSEFWEEEER